MFAHHGMAKRSTKESGRINMKKQKTAHSAPDFIDEDREWLSLTPAQRLLETTKLWEFYIALGGNLDPQPDPQSPFYFKEISR